MNAGDVVQLKSGGPLMTIKDTSRDTPGFQCYYWSPKEEKFLSVIFLESMLALGK